MEFHELHRTVCDELSRSLDTINDVRIGQLIERIGQAKRIFCDGKGRSGLAAAAFAMRLVQMGIQAHLAVEATSPAIEAGDLLIVFTASGETENLVSHVITAKKAGAEIAVVSTNADSKIASNADCCVLVSANSKDKAGTASVQPMGSLFEQSILVMCDVICIILMEKRQLKEQDLRIRHNNME